jgi:hypothetical protein
MNKYDSNTRRTAAHEAGHAVSAILLGGHVQKVQLHDSGPLDGSVTFTLPPSVNSRLHEATISLAGATGTAMLMGDAIDWNGRGCGSDLNTAALATVGHLPVAHDRNIIQTLTRHPRFASASRLALQLVHDNREAIQSLADSLLNSQGSLSSSEIDAVTMRFGLRNSPPVAQPAPKPRAAPRLPASVVPFAKPRPAPAATPGNLDMAAIQRESARADELIRVMAGRPVIDLDVVMAIWG